MDSSKPEKTAPRPEPRNPAGNLIKQAFLHWPKELHPLDLLPAVPTGIALAMLYAEFYKT